MRSRWGLRGIIVLAAFAALSAGACHKKVPPVARPIPAASAVHGRDTEQAAGAGRAVEGTGDDPADAGCRRPPVLGHARRDQQELATEACLLRLRQRGHLSRRASGSSTGTPTCSRRTRGGSSRSRGTAMNAERPSTTWRSANAGRCRARTYLVSLGILADRLRTVSYGKEFPFDPGHNDAAWARNRRDHFVVTQK